MKIEVRLPNEEIPEAYFDVRYETLRKPLGSPRGSEKLAGDESSINVWAELNGKVVGVGRAHLLGENEDGTVFDALANSRCPAFAPLSGKDTHIVDDAGNEIGTDLRPAVQIRAMGTLNAFQGKGVASAVLSACEENSIRTWNAKTGWLQARIHAIPFYEKNGWTCFGPEYHIPNVGLHRSMWKNFENLNR